MTINKFPKTYRIIHDDDVGRVPAVVVGHPTAAQVQRVALRCHHHVRVQRRLLQNFVLLMVRHPIPVPNKIPN